MSLVLIISILMKGFCSHHLQVLHRVDQAVRQVNQVVHRLDQAVHHLNPVHRLDQAVLRAALRLNPVHRLDQALEAVHHLHLQRVVQAHHWLVVMIQSLRMLRSHGQVLQAVLQAQVLHQVDHLQVAHHLQVAAEAQVPAVVPAVEAAHHLQVDQAVLQVHLKRLYGTTLKTLKYVALKQEGLIQVL